MGRISAAAIDMPIIFNGKHIGFWNLIDNSQHYYSDDIPPMLPGSIHASARTLRFKLLIALCKADSTLPLVPIPPISRLHEAVRHLTAFRKFLAVITGNFATRKFHNLLDGMVDFLPSPINWGHPVLNLRKFANKELLFASSYPSFTGILFKLNLKQYHNVFIHMRIYSGIIKQNDTVFNLNNGSTIDADLLFLIHDEEDQGLNGDFNDLKNVKEAYAGQLVSIMSLNPKPHDSGDMVTDGTSRFIKQFIEPLPRRARASQPSDQGKDVLAAKKDNDLYKKWVGDLHQALLARFKVSEKKG